MTNLFSSLIAGLVQEQSQISINLTEPPGDDTWWVPIVIAVIPFIAGAVAWFTQRSDNAKRR